MKDSRSTPPRDARVSVLVAHPDDETLWCGGLLLRHPGWRVFVGTLCRGGDPDRAPKFFRVLERLGAEGAMADLDDGPGQLPLDESTVAETLLSLLPGETWDLVLTHGPEGEYTRHLRHEEVSRAVSRLWRDGILKSKGLWQFAYEDDGGKRLPAARTDAELQVELPEEIWETKHDLVTDVYGFSPESWEARVTPRREAFIAAAKAAGTTPPTNKGERSE